MVEIKLFNEIPIKVDENEETLFLFDIDGTICKETIKFNKDIKGMTQEEILIEQKSCKITPEFIDTMKEIIKLPKAFVKFNTGRRQDVKKETQEMFTKAGLKINVESDVFFYPDNKGWLSDDYKLVKTGVIENQLKKYPKVIYTDDNKPLIENINAVLKGRNLTVIHFTNQPERISKIK